MKLTYQEIINSLFSGEDNSKAILKNNKELLLLLEEETDRTKELAKLYKGKLTSSEVEVLKEKFSNLAKQLQDILTNVNIYKNELMLRQKMNALEVEPEVPRTKKEQFDKEFEDAFDFKNQNQDSSDLEFPNTIDSIGKETKDIIKDVENKS